MGPDPTHMVPSSGHEQHPGAAATSRQGHCFHRWDWRSQATPNSKLGKHALCSRPAPYSDKETEAHRGHQLRGPPLNPQPQGQLNHPLVWTDSGSGHEAGRHPQCSDCYWVGRLDLGPHLPGAGNSCPRTIRPGGTPGPWPVPRKRSSGGSPGPTPYQASTIRGPLPGTPPDSHCPFPQASPVPLTTPSSWVRCPGPYVAQKQSFTQTQGPPPSPAPQSPAHSRAPSTPVTCRQREGLLAAGTLSRAGLLPWVPLACAPRPRPAPSGAAPLGVRTPSGSGVGRAFE